MIKSDAGAAPLWRKSSRSTAGNQCVEIAQTKAPWEARLIRDSKDPTQYLAFSTDEFTAFLAQIKRDDLDL